jgi:hypothetical protein
MTMNKEAILTAIQAVPKRPYQLIAQEFGVSVASVSGVAWIAVRIASLFMVILCASVRRVRVRDPREGS